MKKWLEILINLTILDSIVCRINWQNHPEYSHPQITYWDLDDSWQPQVSYRHQFKTESGYPYVVPDVNQRPQLECQSKTWITSRIMKMITTITLQTMKRHDKASKPFLGHSAPFHPYLR